MNTCKLIHVYIYIYTDQEGALLGTHVVPH